MKLELGVKGEQDRVNVTAVERRYADPDRSPQQRLPDA
jgi:hypothetical protein